MGFDYQTHLDIMVRHYTMLAQTEGWRAYTREMLKDLAKLEPSLYGDLHARVSQALKAAAASEPQTPHAAAK